MTIATAALIQPGDEGRAYGRTTPLWQRWTGKSDASTNDGGMDVTFAA